MFDGILSQQTDQIRSRLAETEEELRQVKSKAGVVSIEEARKGYWEQLTRVQQDLVNALADVAQRRAVLAELRGPSLTNAQNVHTSATVTATEPVPQPNIDEYHRLVARLDFLERREREQLSQLTDENPQVKTNRLLLEAVRVQKNQMEETHPGLLRIAAVAASNPGAAPDLSVQAAQIPALEARIQVLTNELVRLRTQAGAIEDADAKIAQLQRKKTLEESQYTYFARNLEQARFDEALDATKIANISKVQSPSPPFRDFGELYKLMALVVFGSVGAGLGLAFLLEMLLDQTLKRPKDVEALLHAPLFLYVPELPPSTRHARNGHTHGRAGPLLADGDKANGPPVPPSIDLDTRLKPFHDALRDRLINYFDLHEMTHKPKLVAVTSCDYGAGVSSTAVGLAASLSETGAGNVLLVDMKSLPGAACAFTGGHVALGLLDALDNQTRTNALIQEHLYIVSASSSDQSLQRLQPRNFMQYVPQLKTSDYDYIIFDMPAVTQTSVTAKVARFMDMVFLVVESEKTDRQVARRAGALLAESKATVMTILNRHHAYVPRWLHKEFR
jgi:Mrp family chromosome partitioning ATPase